MLHWFGVGIFLHGRKVVIWYIFKACEWQNLSWTDPNISISQLFPDTPSRGSAEWIGLRHGPANQWSLLFWAVVSIHLFRETIYYMDTLHGRRCNWRTSNAMMQRSTYILWLCTTLTFLIPTWCEEKQFVFPLSHHAVQCMLPKILALSSMQDLVLWAGL